MAIYKKLKLTHLQNYKANYICKTLKTDNLKTNRV